jgi:hypothetical protein
MRPDHVPRGARSAAAARENSTVHNGDAALAAIAARHGVPVAAVRPLPGDPQRW